mmetsp:Transcript_110356/g.191314  ORF Transcript_110356/g.191314 Transcript_110356/m.191314 type:complete len:214 (+) Transcript_110356:558-1199(+)
MWRPAGWRLMMWWRRTPLRWWPRCRCRRCACWRWARGRVAARWHLGLPWRSVHWGSCRGAFWRLPLPGLASAPARAAAPTLCLMLARAIRFVDAWWASSSSSTCILCRGISWSHDPFCNSCRSLCCRTRTSRLSSFVSTRGFSVDSVLRCLRPPKLEVRRSLQLFGNLILCHASWILPVHANQQVVALHAVLLHQSARVYMEDVRWLLRGHEA